MDRKGIKIIATGRALPKHPVSNEEFSKKVETSDEWIFSRTGIRQRYHCQGEESCGSLAIRAAREALKGIDLADLGVIVVATTTADSIFPSMAGMIQKTLGLPEDVMAFDISAACSGFVYGLDVCRGLLAGGKKKYALLVGSEQLSRILDYDDRSTCILFGDGAGAALLALSDGIYQHKAWCRGEDKILYCNGVAKDKMAIHMEGQEVFRFAVAAAESSMEEILQKADISLNQVDHIVLHQANDRIIGHIMKKYPEHKDKFYRNIQYYGNTSAASIPIAMDEMKEKGMFKGGDLVLCLAFGGGLTWASSLLQVELGEEKR